MKLALRDNLDRRLCVVIAVAAMAFLLAPVAGAGNIGDNNPCDVEGEAPDVIVGSIHAKAKWGTANNITAWSIGTNSCNIGTCWLDWFQHPSNLHPTIGQNMFRLKDGRFEQLGQSWLKHGFFALSQGLCFNDCQSTSGTHLGVHCSDPYSSSLNGQQNNLGPKFEVNAATGVHPHPVTDLALTGNAIFKRLQARNVDIDPALNPGALYFVEGQYVTADESAAGNGANSASYRKVVMFGSAGNFDFSFDGATVQQEPGILAWETFDTGVELDNVDVPNDGRFIIGSKVTDLGGGMWHYEYAIQNLTSHRSAKSFSVPIPIGSTITNIGFHDVPYHSGEPQHNSPWVDNGGVGSAVTWAASPDDLSDSTNALRWGTLYNFRFDANVEPSTHSVTLGLFRPGGVGEPNIMLTETQSPSLCNSNGTCDPGETGCDCAEDCGPPPSSEEFCTDSIDNDCDFFVDCTDSDCCGDAACPSADVDNDTVLACDDCDDGDAGVWYAPGPVSGLLLSKVGGLYVLNWDPPADPGAINVTYEVLRARDPDDFVNFTQCLPDDDPTDTELADPGGLIAGLNAYMVRALNACPDAGEGALGADSEGVPRAGRSCP